MGSSRSRFRCKWVVTCPATSSSTRSCSMPTSSSRSRSSSGRRARRSSSGRSSRSGRSSPRLGFAVLYALSLVAWFCVARRYGPYAAVATAVALLAYPGYVLLFHELASDALFAAAFALVALLVVRVAEVPTLGRSVAPRPRDRRAGARPSGRSGTRAARARPARGRAWRARASGAVCGLRRGDRPPARRALGTQRDSCRRLRDRARRLGVAPLPHVRCGQDRAAGERHCVGGARESCFARAAPERALPVAGDRSRDVLLLRELSDERRLHRALGPDVGLGRRLRAPGARGA